MMYLLPPLSSSPPPPPPTSSPPPSRLSLSRSLSQYSHVREPAGIFQDAGREDREGEGSAV